MFILLYNDFSILHDLSFTDREIQTRPKIDILNKRN